MDKEAREFMKQLNLDIIEVEDTLKEVEELEPVIEYEKSEEEE